MSDNSYELKSVTSTHSTAWSNKDGNHGSTSMAGVGRAGFIRDPSGLLMSIIRTLAASEDDHLRELEKERLEEAFAENDEKLDELVTANYEELAVSIKQFGKIGDRISDSRKRIKRVKENLQQCKSLLYCRQDDLRKLWVEGVEYKRVLHLLDQIEEVKRSPQKVEEYMSNKFYFHATSLLTQTLKALESELIQVEALHDIRNELTSKKMQMHETLITELHRQIYINSMNIKARKISDHSTNAFVLEKKDSLEDEGKIGKFGKLVLQLEDLNKNPDDDSFKLMRVLVESLACLNKLPEMVEAIKARMDRHINDIVTHTTVEVSDMVCKDDHKSEHDPKRLLELLKLLFQKFHCIVKAHSHVLECMQRILSDSHLDVHVYELEDVWIKIQSVLQLLLHDYLDADNVVAASHQMPGISFSDVGSISLHFRKSKGTRPRVAKLFRFDGSSHAISMNTYLREQRAQRRSDSFTGATSPMMDLSTQKVCKPNPRNITVIFGPLKTFINEIEASLNYLDEKKCSLHEFITDYVQDVFIRQIQCELRKDFDAALKVTDPLKVLAEPAMQISNGSCKCLLQSAVVADQCMWFLFDLTTSLDTYHDHFLSMACSLIQEYKEMSIQSYRGVVQPESEDQRIVSASWVRESKVNELLTKLNNWAAIRSSALHNSKSMKDSFTEEAFFFMERMENVQLGKNSLVEDPSSLKDIACLHETLEWFASRLDSFKSKIRDYAPDDTFQLLSNLHRDYSSMAEICLLCLHIELRLQCFYHLTPMLMNSNYDIRGLESMDHDFQITKLTKDLNAADENLKGALQSSKYQYCFEGLGHQIAALVIGGAKHIKRISPSGVKKMCRNIFTLQQCLSNITMCRESHLDVARQFYEMLYLLPDDLQVQVVEQGVRYSEEDYVEALGLLHRSKPGSGTETVQLSRAQRLRAVVREQTYKKEYAEQMREANGHDK